MNEESALSPQQTVTAAYLRGEVIDVRLTSIAEEEIKVKNSEHSGL